MNLTPRHGMHLWPQAPLEFVLGLLFQVTGSNMMTKRHAMQMLAM